MKLLESFREPSWVESFVVAIKNVPTCFSTPQKELRRNKGVLGVRVGDV